MLKISLGSCTRHVLAFHAMVTAQHEVKHAYCRGHWRASWEPACCCQSLLDAFSVVLTTPRLPLRSTQRSCAFCVASSCSASPTCSVHCWPRSWPPISTRTPISRRCMMPFRRCVTLLPFWYFGLWLGSHGILIDNDTVSRCECRNIISLPWLSQREELLPFSASAWLLNLNWLMAVLLLQGCPCLLPESEKPTPPSPIL